MNSPTQSEFARQPFTISSLGMRANQLSRLQRELLQAVWNHLIQERKPFPIRNLPSILGKASLKQVLAGFNGCLMYEASDQDGRYLELTLYGALLTADGLGIAALLLRLLDFVKARFEQDSSIKTLTSKTIDIELKLAAFEEQILFRALRFGSPRLPVMLSSWGSTDGIWSVSISDDVLELFHSESSLHYLDSRLSQEFRASEPCLIEERQKRFLPPTLSLNDGDDWGQRKSSQIHHTLFVSKERIEELAAISDPRFDCSRLIVMCKELNSCAAQESWHAVILLIRAILNHIPPAFECRTFAEVAANYGGNGKSFKDSAERLENHTRKVADRYTHLPIRRRESVPTKVEVGFSAELESVLSEVCRLLK